MPKRVADSERFQDTGDFENTEPQMDRARKATAAQMANRRYVLYHSIISVNKERLDYSSCGPLTTQWPCCCKIPAC